ncbi:MAG: PilZ domain-containing protein [Thermodesulfobacteriota bacterium]
MNPQRVIKAKDILADINAGFSNAALMEKYCLSAKGLRSALSQLVEAGCLASDDVTTALPEDYHQTLSDLMRKQDRYYIDFELLVCEADNPENRGVLRDINEEGLRVSGISAAVDEVTVLVILGDEFGGIGPFEVEAQCKWTRKQAKTLAPQAGFRITRASGESQDALRRLIAVVTGHGRP